MDSIPGVENRITLTTALIATVIILISFLLIREVLAWTNPTQGPPGGGGMLTISGTTLIVGGGSGKITAGTIDPLYSIGGKNYATYLPGMIGQKEELTGTLNLQCSSGRPCKTVIDFSSATKGSDLWLFYQITDFGERWQNLAVLLSSGSDSRVWYKKEPENSRLIVFSNLSSEVSYRFTAPRFDWQKWGNVSDGLYQGLVPYRQR